MGALLILGILFLFLKSSKGGGNLPFPEANSPVAPADPVAVQQFDDQLQNAVAFNIATGEAQQLKIGESLIGAGFAGIGEAAAQTTTGTLLFSATSWTIIGGIIAAAFVLLESLRTYGHLYANQLVEKYENPFGSYFTQAINAVDRGWQDGSMSSTDIKQIYNALFVAWQNYRAAMMDLIGRGSYWEIVAKQSLNNLNNEYQGERLSNGKVLTVGMGGAYPNGFVTDWLAWLQGRIDYVSAREAGA
jgi:hypothetical protein